MAYIKLTDMRFAPNDKVAYAHKWGDMLVDGLQTLGITAEIKKFEINTSLNTTYVPSWVVSAHASSSIQGSNGNARLYTNACVWFTVDNINYSIVIGNGSGGGELIIEFASAIMPDESNSAIYYRHCMYGTSSIGVADKRDFLTIAKGDGGFHMSFRRDGLSVTYYGYAGHCRTSYNNKVFVPVFNLIAEKPSHSNLGNTLKLGTLALSMASCINSAVGDVLTNKYYAFDIFLGITSGTIFGTLNNVFCIPYCKGSYVGDIVNVGGEFYMYITTVDGYGMYARV